MNNITPGTQVKWHDITLTAIPMEPRYQRPAGASGCAICPLDQTPDCNKIASRYRCGGIYWIGLNDLVPYLAWRLTE